MSLVVTTVGAPGTEWVEDKDAAKHPVTHRIVPQAKSYLAQKISSNEAAANLMGALNGTDFRKADC